MGRMENLSMFASHCKYSNKSNSEQPVFSETDGIKISQDSFTLIFAN